MENVLEVRKLRKKYDSFELQDISLDLPREASWGLLAKRSWKNYCNQADLEPNSC